MSGIEIYEKINANNKIIHEALRKFVLNEEIKKLLAENQSLKEICPHEFVNGVCKFCGTKETK